jgi:hypothetical protein
MTGDRVAAYTVEETENQFSPKFYVYHRREEMSKQRKQEERSVNGEAIREQ